MAATLTTGEIWRAFLGSTAQSRHFFHGHTYSGNPLAAAVALASLDVFEDERVLERLPAKIALLHEGLAEIGRCRLAGDVRQRGLIAGVELVRDRGSREPFAWGQQVGRRACRLARERGVLLRPLGDVVVIMPPLAVSHDELVRLTQTVKQCLDSLASDRELVP
jgi:adenosylmethionine-8-amino-7-oxononanoate aminotransferase